MELDAHDVVLFDGCGEGASVVTHCGGCIYDGCAPGVGVVDEASEGDVAEEAGAGADVFDGVPAYVRGFERRTFVFGGEMFTVAGDVAKAGRGGGFGGALEEPLQADADAEKPGAARDALADGLGEAERGEKLRGLEVADAGKDDLCGFADDVGVLRNDDLLRAKVGERLDDAGEVAGFVVDDGDHKSSKKQLEAAKSSERQRVSRSDGG